MTQSCCRTAKQQSKKTYLIERLTQALRDIYIFIYFILVLEDLEYYDLCYATEVLGYIMLISAVFVQKIFYSTNPWLYSFDLKFISF